MSQNTLQNDQNNQNDQTFTEFNNLQSTVIQPGHSSNINYNDVNANSSDNNFPTFYTDTNYSDQQPIYNENISTPIVSSFDIPGFKIIVIPTFSQQDNNHLNYSSNITNTQYQ
ncbi:hypothetical protein RhiirA1_464527 [Rhizophagus irregularis]|uniref:Uncharacterized protein n=1 Tax=Rhizophagus irregularis TaxID=588596 RepID=A0A2N0RHW4_9GLOM|nr:hypothetical protein RhiirA1_464527 [Rhizophagus irregularis]